MTTLAILYIACQAFALLPGSSIKGGLRWREVDWGSPHPYAQITGSLLAIALAVAVLV